MQVQTRTENLYGRAARLNKFGEPFRIEEVPKPRAGPNEVVLKVRAAGICHTDIYLMQGASPMNLPISLGHEIAGEIDETGPGAEEFKRGDRFVVHFLSPCGRCRYCIEGRGMQCETLLARPFHGFDIDGGYAQYCKVATDRLVSVPQEVPWSFAATLGCAGLTAYHSVKTIGKVRLGEEVGVYGAGGLGMYAIQFAKQSGAGVVAVGRNEEKLKMAERLGADSVVNASNADVKDQVRKATGGRGVDVMFDFVATDESLKNSTASLAKGGRYVLVGATNKPLPVNGLAFMFGEFSFSGSLAGTKQELAATIERAKNNRLQSVATANFPLEEINTGIESLNRGEIVGRATVSP